jgi:hypothetical protein
VKNATGIVAVCVHRYRLGQLHGLSALDADTRRDRDASARLTSHLLARPYGEG